MGFLTPDNSPTDTICRVVLIPNDEAYLANVRGALELLTIPDRWEQYGTLTPEEAAQNFVPMFDAFCFNQGECRMIGEIIPYAGSTSPDTRWLFCDGTSLLRADYPDLFTVIGTNYGSADGTHFNLPDLRNNVMVGAGDLYSLASTGGEAAHTLITSEMPGHSHTDTGHVHSEVTAVPAVGAAITGVPVPSAVPGVGLTGSGSASITSTGGDGAHNNLQPYIAINFLIVALP